MGIERWLAIHDDPRLAFLSPARRVTVANSILLSEAQGRPATPTSEPPPTRWFEVTDWGRQSEEWLRQNLRADGYAAWDTADIDTIMCEWGKTKVVTPLDPAVPPFYLINGEWESIYELRLRIKAMFDDNWNIMSRDDVVARLRANNDTVQPL